MVAPTNRHTSLGGNSASETDVDGVPAALVTIEVCSLGGEVVLHRAFGLKERVESVKEQVRLVRDVPVYQQQLVWQGSTLDNHQVLGDLGLTSQGVVLQLAVQIVPDDAEISRARKLLEESDEAVDLLDENTIREFEMRTCPPLAVEVVSIGVLYLLAGISPKIETKLNGTPKDPSWSACQKMLRDPKFTEHLRQVPRRIGSGKVCQKNILASGKRYKTLQPFIDAQMANDCRCETRAARGLFTWLRVINTFHQVVTGITDRLGDSLGNTSLIDVISHAPTEARQRSSLGGA